MLLGITSLGQAHMNAWSFDGILLKMCLKQTLQNENRQTLQEDATVNQELERLKEVFVYWIDLKGIGNRKTITFFSNTAEWRN